MPHIRNHKAYAAAVIRNAARKTGRAIVKKAKSYLKDPRKAQKDFQRGAAFVHSISGSGDYGIPHSAGIQSKGGRGIIEHGNMGHGNPKIHLEKGEMVISHTEYIGDLVSSATTGASNFVSQSYGINPGNPATFPWLSAVAINFQDYRFDKLVFEYIPLVSESTATTAATLTSMGTVIMATQYDSVLGPFTNKPTMENSDFAVSGKPSERMRHAVECASRFNPLGQLYVSGNLNTTTSGITNADIRFQNLGIFEIASSNIPIASSTALSLGMVYVHYKVRLYKPVLNAGLTNVLSTFAQSTTCTNANTFLGFANSSTSLMGLTYSGSTFSFPLAITEGSFLCTYYYVGNAAGASLSVPTLTVANGTIPSYFCGPSGTNGSQQGDWAPPDNAGYNSPAVMLQFIVSVNAPGSALCTVTITSVDFLPGTCVRAQFLCTPWNVLTTN